MYRVLIVDDEPLAREYVKKIVDWDSLDLTICGEAEDGVDALNKVKELRPDIILLDVIMPNMDGLAFAECIRENNIKTSIVIISGSDEFDYVRQSIKLEVKDYILKPFDVDEIQDALIRIITELSKEDKSSKLSLRSVVYNVLMNPVDENVTAARMYFANNTVSSYQVAVIYCHKESYREDIIYKLRQHSNKHKQLVYVKNATNRIICFYANMANVDLDLKLVFSEFFDKYHRYERELLVGVGDSTESIEMIKESYSQAVETVNNGVIFGDHGVYSYEAKPSELYTYFYSTSDIEKLLVSLRCSDKDNVTKKIYKIYENLEDNKVEYSHLLSVSNGLISICASTIVEKSKSVQDKYDQSGHVINFNNRSLQEIRDSVVEFYMKAIDLSKSTMLTKAQQVALESAEFITKNYENPALSISLIAEFVHLEESYVRRVFKKANGKTINNYIIEYRMQKAKELLLEKKHKHSTIAEMVGYIDAAYFSKSFKKTVGQSPKEFELSN